MQYEVHIESLVYGGSGLGHLPDGKVVFVPGALPNDHILVELTVEKERYSQGRLVGHLDENTLRLVAPCAFAEVCGGCPWQCLSYPEQLDWKRRFVVDALQRIGGEDAAESLVGETVASNKPWHYRNKVEFSVFQANGHLQLGMHGSGDHQPVAVNRCLLLPEHLTDLPGALAGSLGYALGSELVQPYRVGIRHSARTRQTELALWSTPTGMRRAFVADLFSKTADYSSLVRVLTHGQDSAREVVRTEALAGRGHWVEELRVSGHRFGMTVSAASFFQVNTTVADSMIETVLQSIDDINGHVWDLYSGVGTFSLPLAHAGARISAVELAGSSIRDFRRNAATHRFEDSAQMFPGDVALVVQSLKTPDSIVVDPPSIGMDKGVIAAINSSPAAQLIYVSCDPQTLARDTARLRKSGFRLCSAVPFDLFPQSYHVETIAVFRR